MVHTPGPVLPETKDISIRRMTVVLLFSLSFLFFFFKDMTISQDSMCLQLDYFIEKRVYKTPGSCEKG